MWIDGERSCAMTIPRSRLVVTYGSTVSYTEYLTSKGTWPIVNILHLLTDNCNYHVEAHSTIKSRAPCNITVSDTFTICKYTLTSSANNFTIIIPWLSNSFANSSIYTRNKTGPMPLSWTTPLRRLAATDRHCPILVWCVRSLRKFWGHFRTSSRITWVQAGQQLCVWHCQNTWKKSIFICNRYCFLILNKYCPIINRL